MSSYEPKTCIFCGEVREFTDEHVFPAGLGGDDKQFLLRGMVCGNCNTLVFSKMELRFMRSSPAAVGRQFLQPNSRKRGKKKTSPILYTRTTTVFTEEYGAVEAEITAMGKPLILPQILFRGKDIIGYIGDNTEELNCYIETLVSTLSDIVHVVHKIVNADMIEYKVEILRWNGEQFLLLSQQVSNKPPKNCVWREILEPSSKGEVYRQTTLYLRREGQLVLRLATDGDFIGLLTQARKAAPLMLGKTGKITHVENPLVKLVMSIDCNDENKVYAKIGLNIIAYALGEDYIRHHAFNKIKKSILTGKSTIKMVTPPAISDPFNGVPKDRHVAMIYFHKSRAGRFYVALAIRLYGAPYKWVLLSDNAIKPPRQDAILVVHYKDHRIEEFSSLRQFAMAYPLTIPDEFKQHIMQSMLSNFNI